MESRTQTYKIDNMKCNGCRTAVEEAVHAQDSQAKVIVNLEEHQATISSTLTDDEILKAITAAGFPTTVK